MNPNQNELENPTDKAPFGDSPQPSTGSAPSQPSVPGSDTSYQPPSFLRPEQQPASQQTPAPIVQPEVPPIPSFTTPATSNNLVQPSSGLDSLPSVTPNPPKAKPLLNKRTIIIVAIVVAVLLIGSIATVLLFKKDKKTTESSKSSNNNTSTDYSSMKPADMFNNLISEFGKDSSVVAGPLHKGVDAGGDGFKNMTTAYDSANDQFLWIASASGGVEFSVTDNSATEPCKQRLDKVSKYRDKLVSVLDQAGYKAVKTRFDDMKDPKGKTICVENTAYYNESSKIYCSEGRSANEKSLTFDIACTDQRHAAGRIASSKEIVPLLKAAKANQESYIILSVPQKSATAGYETLFILHKPMTDGMFNDIGAYRKTDQPWKLLPGNSSSIQEFDCSILAKDPDIAKAYAGKECYTGSTTQKRKI